MVVASESYVARYMGDREPIGARVILGPGGSRTPCEIIGLYRDLRFNGLSTPPDPTIYLPTSHYPNRQFFVVIRASGDPMGLLPAVRQAISEFDPGLAVWAPAPMTDLVSESMRTPRQVAALVGAFAILSLLLAASGVYGVVTYNVNSRMREFGVRTALGANQFDLLRLVLVGGLWLVGAGMAIGVILTAFSGRLLSTLLYEVEPFDLQETRVKADGWTVATADGSLAAHWEHTIAVTADGPRILTLAAGEVIEGLPAAVGASA